MDFQRQSICVWHTNQWKNNLKKHSKKKHKKSKHNEIKMLKTESSTTGFALIIFMDKYRDLDLNWMYTLLPLEPLTCKLGKMKSFKENALVGVILKHPWNGQNPLQQCTGNKKGWSMINDPHGGMPKHKGGQIHLKLWIGALH